MDNRLIGLEVSEAEWLLKRLGIADFKFIYYTDRKQTKYDKEIVTAVRVKDGDFLEIVVCKYQFGA